MHSENEALFHNYLLTSVQYVVLGKVYYKSTSSMPSYHTKKICRTITVTKQIHMTIMDFETVHHC